MKSIFSSKDPHNKTGLPSPFTIEQLREDILNIYFIQLKSMHLFSSERDLWALARKEAIPEGEIWIGKKSPKDFGITYEDIQDSYFAKALEQQYCFAFLGLDNQLCEPMAMDTIHTWVAAYLLDFKSSIFVSEWDSNGTEINVSRCIHTCELANARNVLEGGENFFPYTNSKDDENKCEEALSVHQIALLSGMEEMTIRTAISRKGPNQLRSFKDDRKTLIKITDAKDWLIAKEKYVAVTRQAGAGETLRLETNNFRSIYSFSRAMASRITFLEQKYPELNTTQRILNVAKTMAMKDLNFTDRDDLLNDRLMSKIAEILQLPGPLLVLRAREAVQIDELSKTTAAILEETIK